MFLTHLVLADENYRKIAKESTGYKILDNSLIELDGAMDMSDVLTAAAMIDADEVVLPDVFMKGPETVNATMNALKEYKHELKKYKTMAVVHGADEDEWLHTFLYFDSIDAIDVLGIPKVMNKQFTRMLMSGRVSSGRPRVLGEVIDLATKEIHLLGLWNEFSELKQYGRNILKIRSIDTSLPSLQEVNKRSIFSRRDKCEIQTIDLVNDCISSEGNTEGARKYVNSLITSVQANVQGRRG